MPTTRSRSKQQQEAASQVTAPMPRPSYALQSEESIACVVPGRARPVTAARAPAESRILCSASSMSVLRTDRTVDVSIHRNASKRPVSPGSTTAYSKRARSILEMREEDIKAPSARLQAEEHADEKDFDSETDSELPRVEEWVDEQRRLTETRVKATPVSNVSAGPSCQTPQPSYSMPRVQLQLPCSMPGLSLQPSCSSPGVPPQPPCSMPDPPLQPPCSVRGPSPRPSYSLPGVPPQPPRSVLGLPPQLPVLPPQPPCSVPGTLLQPSYSVPGTSLQPSNSLPVLPPQPPCSVTGTSPQPSYSLPGVPPQPPCPVTGTSPQPSYFLPGVPPQPPCSVPGTSPQPSYFLPGVPPQPPCSVTGTSPQPSYFLPGVPPQPPCSVTGTSPQPPCSVPGTSPQPSYFLPGVPPQPPCSVPGTSPQPSYFLPGVPPQPPCSVPGTSPQPSYFLPGVPPQPPYSVPGPSLQLSYSLPGAPPRPSYSMLGLPSQLPRPAPALTPQPSYVMKNPPLQPPCSASGLLPLPSYSAPNLPPLPPHSVPDLSLQQSYLRPGLPTQPTCSMPNSLPHLSYSMPELPPQPSCYMPGLPLYQSSGQPPCMPKSSSSVLTDEERRRVVEMASAVIEATRIAALPAANPAATFATPTGAASTGPSAQIVSHRYLLSELPAFNGSHEEWLAFRAAYNETSQHFSATENTARLRRALEGKAKEAARSLLIANTEPESIMNALENRFGRPDSIALAEIDRIKSMPRVADSPHEVCEFANRIQNSVAVLRALKRPHYLSNPELVRSLTEKLASGMKRQWYTYYAAKPQDEPDLVSFHNFLEMEAALCRPFAPPEIIRAAGSSALGERAPGKSRPQRTCVVEEKQTEPSLQVTCAIENKRIASLTTCVVCKFTDHTPNKCPIIRAAVTEDRWSIAKKQHLCFRCLQHRTSKHRCVPKKCGVDNCARLHHTLLHYSPSIRPAEAATVATTSSRGSYSYLKILPVRLSGPRGHFDTFALLDDGSTITLLDADVAAKLGIRGRPQPLELAGALAGMQTRSSKSQLVNINIEGQGKQHTIKARTVSQLNLSPQGVDFNKICEYKHLEGIRKHLVYEAGRPTVLIGQDNWPLLVAGEIKRGSATQPAASRTPLGWVLHGACTRSIGRQIHTTRYTREERMDEELRNFFALESLGVEPRRTRADPEARALRLLRENTVARVGGGYETSLLWKADNTSLPNNYESAFKRLKTIEHKLDREPELRAGYLQQMENLLQKGYAEETTAEITPGKTWYLPHFGVVHPAKPGKLRVVFDAAARSGGTSLNEHLLPGPDLLQSLPGVLMRFRQHPVAVAADIEEMFLRIGIREQDRDTLRFLWRGDKREGPPRQFRMKSVIFGAASSPCTALYVKDLNAEQHRRELPEAAEAVVVHHYMDDYLQSFSTTAQAVQIAAGVKQIHAKANFRLHKWTSNYPDVVTSLREAPASATASANMTVALDDGSRDEKVLGLVWRPLTDTLGFNMSMARVATDIASGERTPTKREALRLVMSVFDPLGLASPVTIQAKRILQETWRKGVGWDRQLPSPLAEQWREWISNLQQLRHLEIPRCHVGWTNAQRRELHIFVDASETAYAAAVYWRTIRADSRIEISLATAKARVTPLKITSVPRLELQAAVLGCRLGATAEKEYQIKPDQKFFWTDSLTVLAWLQAGPRTLKTFVAHRVAEIEESTAIDEWRWLPSKHNVADDATRQTPSEFTTQHRWFTGPQFLFDTEENWPARIESVSLEPTGEERIHTLRICKPSLLEALPNVNRFSSWDRLMRATARALQFIQILRRRTTKTEHCFHKRTAKRPEEDPTWGKRRRKAAPSTPRTSKTHVGCVIPLDAELIRAAEDLWVRASQQEKFALEVEALQRRTALPRDSRIRLLAVYIDPEGTLRVRSRIENVKDISYHQKSPAILDGDHRLARLYIDRLHRKLHHGGVEMVVNEVRGHYWILRLRPTVKSILKACLRCRLLRATPAIPPTGDHPRCRLAHHRRPFTFVGLDYFGPLSVTVGRRHERRYVALFTCLTTRAVHLELADNLSTDSAIMALRRMIARRGNPEEICSDNGTNFKGASRELHQALVDEAATRAIKWRFIPPGAPFMGGAWERLVRSVKTALYSVLTDRHPHVETLTTLLCEVEYTVNSRPLTHVSTSPDDADALTPNHFLLGGSGLVRQPGVFTDEDLRLRARWRWGQRLADLFWERWLREYLPVLQNRREPHGRGEPPRIGDIVLIVDTSSPRNTWPKGKVVRLYPGHDRIVRVADVQTRAGVLRRAIKRLVVLPTASSDTPSLPDETCSA